jgi:hypothetical protein
MGGRVEASWTHSSRFYPSNTRKEMPQKGSKVRIPARTSVFLSVEPEKAFSDVVGGTKWVFVGMWARRQVKEKPLQASVTTEPLTCPVGF